LLKTGFTLAVVVVGVMAVVLLQPFSADEVDIDAVNGAVGADTSRMSAAEDMQGDEERQPVLPGGPEGERIRIDGSITLDGSPLPRAAVQAFADFSKTAGPVLADRIRSMPFYYSAAGAKLKEIVEDSSFFEEPVEGPPPCAAAVTDSAGFFTMSVVCSESVMFGMDHDFYFIPDSQAGPYSWVEKDEEQTLDGFSGSLSVDLGALVRGVVIDSGGIPIEGAIIELVQDNEGTGRGMGGGAPWDRGRGNSFSRRYAVTDDGGAFLFRGVQADVTLRAKVRMDGWAPGQSKTFETVAGEVHRLDLRLLEGASILVRVNGPDGEALGGAQAFLERERGQGQGQQGRGMGGFMGGTSSITDSAETGVQGTTLFENLEPGSYSVRAYYPGMLESTTLEPVDVPEEPRTIQVKLALSSGSAITGFVVDDRERPVAGAALEAGEHADSSNFMGRMRAGFQRISTPESGQKKVISGVDGEFAITGLPTDVKLFDLLAQADGYLSARIEEVQPDSAGILLVMDRPGQIEGKVINANTANPVCRFEVRVLPAPETEQGRDGQDAAGGRGNQGRGRGSMGRNDRGGPGGSSGFPIDIGRMMVNRGFNGGRGSPFGGADESTRESLSTVLDSVSESMRVYFGTSDPLTDRKEEFNDQQGRFLLNNIVPGRYRLCVSADGFAPKVTDACDVEMGRKVLNVVVGLGPGASISGQVTADTGPVSSASVRIRSTGRPDPDLSLALETVEDCESGPDGMFEIRNLPEGEFELRAEHEDHPRASTDPLALEEGQDLGGVIIAFPPGATVIGLALDARGMPLVDQSVQCSSSNRGGNSGGGRRRSARVRTDKEGRFEIRDLMAGTYTVSLSSGFRGLFNAGGGDDASAEVSLKEGEVREVVLQREIPEGVVVQGVITDGFEALNSGFLIVSPTQDAGRNSIRSAAINEGGAYRVEGVKPGTNSFAIRFNNGNSFENATLEFEIPDVPEFFQDITLPGGGISGIVVDGTTGFPMAGVRVSLSNMDNDTPSDTGDRGNRRGRIMGFISGRGKSMTTGEDGEFRFRMLSAGSYRVRAQHYGSSDSSGDAGYYPVEIDGIVLAEGQSRSGFKVLLYMGGGVFVRVTDKGNTPMDRAIVSAALEGDGTGGSGQGGFTGGARERTNEEGEAELGNMEPGEYTINVQSRGMAQKAVKSVYVSSGRFTEINVSLDKGFAVSVRLKDGEGQSITGANLTLKNAQGSALVIPQDRGGSGRNTYNLGNLSPGSYTLKAEWNGNSGSSKLNVEQAGSITLVMK